MTNKDAVTAIMISILQGAHIVAHQLAENSDSYGKGPAMADLGDIHLEVEKVWDMMGVPDSFPLNPLLKSKEVASP